MSATHATEKVRIALGPNVRVYHDPDCHHVRGRGQLMNRRDANRLGFHPAQCLQGGGDE